MKELTKHRVEYIKKNIDEKSLSEIAKDLNLLSFVNIRYYIDRYKIKRINGPKSRYKPIPVIVMDFELNIINKYKSLSETRRKEGVKGKFCLYSIKKLKDGYVMFFNNKLIVLEEFYNKEHMFKYTTRARNLCVPVQKEIERKKQKKKSLKNIIILDEYYNEIEVYNGTLVSLANRECMPTGTLKAKLHKNPKVLKTIIDGYGSRRSKHDLIYIYKKDLDLINLENIKL